MNDFVDYRGWMAADPAQRRKWNCAIDLPSREKVKREQPASPLPSGTNKS